jgi:hypothetical protein
MASADVRLPVSAVTYYAVDKGYKVQSPVTHEIPKKQQDKE